MVKLTARELSSKPSKPDTVADPMISLLNAFCDNNHERVHVLKRRFIHLEARVKDLARGLAEPEDSAVESLLSPIVAFLGALERAHGENVLEQAAAERRRQRAEAQKLPKSANRLSSEEAPPLEP